MKKIALILGVILAVAMLACLLPLPSGFSETLDAFKLDEQGNIVGTVQIPVRGVKSLMQAKLHGVKIGAFDGMEETETLQISRFKKDPILGFWKISIAVVKTDFDVPTPENPTTGSIAADSYLYTIAFSEDLDRWMISVTSNNTAKVCYLGSVDAKYTAEELAEYFDITVKL